MDRNLNGVMEAIFGALNTPTPALRADPPHKGEGKTCLARDMRPASLSCLWVAILRRVEDPALGDEVAAGWGENVDQQMVPIAHTLRGVDEVGRDDQH